MDILGQHLHRWRDLKVLLEDHDQAQLILRPLEDLCKQISDGSTTSQLASIPIPPTATLRVIELLGVDLACVSAAPLTAFRSLRKLSLSSVENMHLETHLFGALAAMPNIAILILDQCVFIVPRLGEDDTPDIILPKLVVLQLSLIRDETANHIFSKLHAPNLDTFEWYSRRLESPSAILNWDVLRKRYSTLSSLKLRNITSYATKHLLRWLRELRDLRWLTVIFGELLSPRNVRRSAEEILQLLSETENPCCVMLQRLKIGDIDENGLARLQATIQAKPGLKIGRVSAILQPGTQNSKKRKEVMDWLRSHHFNYNIYELLQDGSDQEDREEDSEDESDEE
ncbi:hypothetical protein FRC09_018663 [Ceratobasidium sp. 395]|nr:hypothetical protein FRC09_018663 [Ceratobasidium sp. 395]